jgi:hypothetical protein
VFRTLLDNPLARREWRSLARLCRNPRFWLNLPIEKSPLELGVGMVAWYALLPYAVWLMLIVLTHLVGRRVLPVLPDMLSLAMLPTGLHVALVPIPLLAPTLSQARAAGEWAKLRALAPRPVDMLLGLLAGRLGPVLATYLGVGLFWVLARPHYAALLQPYCPTLIDGPAIAVRVWESVALSLAVGAASLEAGAVCRTARGALALATFGALSLVGPVTAALFFLPHQPTSVLIFGFCLPMTALAFRNASRRLAREDNQGEDPRPSAG